MQIIKGILVGKEVKLTLLTDALDAPNSYQKISRNNKCSNVADYRSHLHKSIAFLCINNKHTEKSIICL